MDLAVEIERLARNYRMSHNLLVHAARTTYRQDPDGLAVHRRFQERELFDYSRKFDMWKINLNTIIEWEKNAKKFRLIVDLTEDRVEQRDVELDVLRGWGDFRPQV